MYFADDLRNLTLTENGAITLKYTKDSSLHLFYTVGASRGKDIILLFKPSLEDSLIFQLETLFGLEREQAVEKESFYGYSAVHRK